MQKYSVHGLVCVRAYLTLFKCLELMPHVGIKTKLDVFEAKIEESEKAGSRRESNPGHLACAASALPLS